MVPVFVKTKEEHGGTEAWALVQAVATRVAGEVIVELGSSNPQGAATYERTYASMKRFIDSYRRNAKILALIEQVGTFTPEMKQIRLQVREAGVERMTRIIEHHQAVMAHADWILDLGPGAGHDGGTLVFEGTPAQLVEEASTLTGQHLAAYVAG